MPYMTNGMSDFSGQGRQRSPTYGQSSYQPSGSGMYSSQGFQTNGYQTQADPYQQNTPSGYQGWNPSAPQGQQGIYPGPYGQTIPKYQETYASPYMQAANNANPYTQQQQQSMTDYTNHAWGNWNDPKVAAGNTAYASAYGVPMLQAQQNARNQAFTEGSFALNFAEQQYLNKNATALDWAANSREDAGLNYAIQSGNQQFKEGARQFDVTSGQGQFNLNTQRAQQEALAAYQRGEISLGEAQNVIASARQKADETFQTGSLSNDRADIDNKYAIAQKQNAIDEQYKQGLITVQQRDAATNELRASNDFTLGKEQNANTRYATDVQSQLGTEANAIDRLKVSNDFQVASRANEIDQAYKSGLITVQQRDAATNELRAQNEFTMGTQKNANELQLGLGGLAEQRYATDIGAQLGNRNAAIGEYEAQTGRQRAGNEYDIANRQQLLDQMVRTGQLSVDQYQAETARLQQGSQQQQWQQQLAAQQSQFGQTLNLQQQQLQADKLNARYSAFGRAQAPNMAAWNRSW